MSFANKWIRARGLSLPVQRLLKTISIFSFWSIVAVGVEVGVGAGVEVGSGVLLTVVTVDVVGADVVVSIALTE